MKLRRWTIASLIVLQVASLVASIGSGVVATTTTTTTMTTSMTDGGSRGRGVGRSRCRRRFRVIGMASIVVPSTAVNAAMMELRGGSTTSCVDDSPDDNDGVTASENDTRRTQTITALHQTSFLMAASVSMVLFAPLPTLTKYLRNVVSSLSPPPQARAIQILATLSAITAAVELLLSPLIGVLIDTHGRRVPAATLHGLVSMANLVASTIPGVYTVCLSRVANVLGGGFGVIITNAIIADLFGGSTIKSGGGEGMGAALGTQAASASFGFLLGSLIGGRLTEYGERFAYGACSALSALAMCNVVFRMSESLDVGRQRSADENPRDDIIYHRERQQAGLSVLTTKFVEAPLSSVRLLYRYGSRMRTLAALLVLQSIPMYMGDVFQLFSKEEWGLRPREFANLVALFGILGIVSNISVPFVIRSIGLRSFSIFATCSSLLFPLTTLLAESYKIVVAAGCLGLFGSAQKLGTSAAMTSLALELGVPQGRLQGEKASMLALLKIGSPIVYGMLYLRGKTWSADATTGGVGGSDKLWSHVVMGKIGRKLPFVLNVVLGLCALAVMWQNL